MPNLKTLALAGLLGASAALAQIAPADDPDWKEVDAPQPPAPDLARLVPFDVRPDSPLRFGVDPASVSIGHDSVVRYVVVAHGRGVVNAMYEGLRCLTGEVRTYARYNDGRWTPVGKSEWRTLTSGAATQHAMMLARQGACDGRSPPRTADMLIRKLRGQDPDSFHR